MDINYFLTIMFAAGAGAGEGGGGACHVSHHPPCRMSCGKMGIGGGGSHVCWNCLRFLLVLFVEFVVVR